ncbi:MAG: hypothetical protein ACWGPN_16555, partial [Gammaproteobacteria bacterium]
SGRSASTSVTGTDQRASGVAAARQNPAQVRRSGSGNGFGARGARSAQPSIFAVPGKLSGRA